MDVDARLCRSVAAMLVIVFAPLAAAHHSTAEFDYAKHLTIKGTVKELQWTNPHSYIQLMVDDPAGPPVQWSVEIGSPSININMGWRKSSVKPGNVVSIELAPARSGKAYGTLRILTFADGRQLEGVANRVKGLALAPPKGP